MTSNCRFAGCARNRTLGIGTIRHGAAVAVLLCNWSHAVAFAEPQRQTGRVCISHTVLKDELSRPAFTTLQDEATRIWQRHGIALSWTQRAPAACHVVVPIKFDEEAFLRHGGGTRDNAVGLTQFLGPTVTIYVSVPRAFQMLAQLGNVALNVNSWGQRDFRAGTLLGRVVAHELGHVLLSTLSHSQTGLMRPLFGVREVLSADRRLTDLSALESKSLATRFALPSISPPPAVLARGGMTPPARGDR